MATLVRMPEVLTGITEAAIQTWLVAEGDAVAVGTPLAEVETEKAVVEYTAETEGTVLQLVAPAGGSVAIGDPIAVIGAPGEDASSVVPAAGASAAPAAPAEPAAPASEPAVAEAPAEADPAAPEVADAVADAQPAVAATPAAPDSASGARRFMSPLVRRLAKERGIDLSSVTGTGPNGRIVRRDIEGLSASAPAAEPAASAASGAATADASVEEIPLSGMRKAIARRLTESKSTVPHFYVVADCRVDELLALRKQVNAAQDTKISVNDFILKAVAGALRDVPEANSTWADTVIHRHNSVDIAVAVALDDGLITPVVRDVDRLALSEISKTVGEMAGRAREGRLKQHELEGGSFSVSNLGMYGTSEFSAIINPPHAGILAVGAARPMPVIEGDELAIGQVMTVTLSADHRVIDGAVGAQWLAAFQRRIENPMSMLV